MLKWIVTIVVSLGVGFALAGRLLPDKGDSSAAPSEPGSFFDASAPLEQRLAALERAVGEERYARQVLQEEILALTAEVEALGPPGRARVGTTSQDAPDSAAPPGDARSRAEETRRADMLVAAGFPAGQAEWIVQREAELQMESLKARYEAERSGDPVSWYEGRNAAASALRAELGDADYERYRDATGRSTSAAVGSIIEGSPAHRVGLQRGDQITRYDGERIFSMSDLSEQILRGEPGEQVVVDVSRDGVAMQFVVPRGPLGVWGGAR